LQIRGELLVMWQNRSIRLWHGKEESIFVISKEVLLTEVDRAVDDRWCVELVLTISEELFMPLHGQMRYESSQEY
jgi:hypothetical protein